MRVSNVHILRHISTWINPLLTFILKSYVIASYAFNILVLDIYIYDKNITADRGRPKKEHDENNLIKLCEDMIAERKIYSDEKTDEIFEDKKGFLENITKKLHKELQIIYPELEERHLSEIKFRLVGLAPDLPIANKDIIVFRNSKWNTAEHKITETDDLADMGFKGYDYLPPAKENEPTEFIKVMFETGSLNRAIKSISFNVIYYNMMNLIYVE